MPKWTEYTSKDTLADNDEVMLYDATARANKRGLMSKFWDYVVDKMATAVISKLETNNKTIIGAINALNSEKVGNFNIITTNVTTGAQYGDFNVYFDGKTYTEIPALIINPNKVQGVNFVLNDFLYVNNSKQINGVKLQAEKSGNWYVSKAITITIATFGK